MKRVNKKNVSEVRNAVYNFNMGFISRAEFASEMARARAPYMGRVHNFLLYVADRIYLRVNNMGVTTAM